LGLRRVLLRVLLLRILLLRVLLLGILLLRVLLLRILLRVLIPGLILVLGLRIATTAGNQYAADGESTERGKKKGT